MSTRSRRRDRARRGVAVGLLAATSAVAACTGDDDVTPTTTVVVGPTTIAPERSDDGQLVIGVYLPRTGEGAQIGEPMISAIEQAIVLINAAGGVLGREVRHETLDEGIGTGPEELLAAGVDAIVGPASSLVALRELETIVQPTTGVVVCSPTATALLLDRYPDNGYFFRTVPSDSLQMAAIARVAENTGRTSVAVGYLDDPYGRGLSGSLLDEIETRKRLTVVGEVGFSADQEDLSAVATELMADDPGVVAVLGDADDGGRLLAALDQEIGDDTTPPQIVVNDAIRTARQAIQGLSVEFRQRLLGVAPLADPPDPDAPEGFFAAYAVDCVNLIALATMQAGTDGPTGIRTYMTAVSTGGIQCNDFATCAERLASGLRIDYVGLSGSVDLSTATGDPVRATFEVFGFDDEGAEVGPRAIDAP